MSLDMLVGKDKDGELIFLWIAVQLGTSGGCAMLPPLAGKRTGGAVWPWTEDTQRCGRFKPRSDVESEPAKEEF